MAASTLIMNEQMLLISEDGRAWTLVANVTTDAEIKAEKRKVPEGVHMLIAGRFQLETKGPDGEEER
jgi:hypothetical protein